MLSLLTEKITTNENIYNQHCTNLFTLEKIKYFRDILRLLTQAAKGFETGYKNYTIDLQIDNKF